MITFILSIIVGWNANSENDLAGYRIHYGVESRHYIKIVDTNQTSYRLTGLKENVQYFLAVTAYDSADNESEYSDEITFTLQNKPVQETKKFYLAQNYPNPFNGSTIIEYSLKSPMNYVSLVIYNSSGQKVTELINKYQRNGVYKIAWITDMPSGIYFYKLCITGVGSYIKKMEIIK